MTTNQDTNRWHSGLTGAAYERWLKLERERYELEARQDELCRQYWKQRFGNRASLFETLVKALRSLVERFLTLGCPRTKAASENASTRR
ncbi:MAG: hypothetical protein KGL39_24750 [Patescibacteria group bacterium]|nr:hypothetical protein [Patescibacteria group bacterium]